MARSFRTENIYSHTWDIYFKPENRIISRSNAISDRVFINFLSPYQIGIYLPGSNKYYIYCSWCNLVKVYSCDVLLVQCYKHAHHWYVPCESVEPYFHSSPCICRIMSIIVVTTITFYCIIVVREKLLKSDITYNYSTRQQKYHDFMLWCSVVHTPNLIANDKNEFNISQNISKSRKITLSCI